MLSKNGLCVVLGIFTLFCSSLSRAAMIAVNAFNDNIPATVSANDGTNSVSFATLLTQFNVTLTPDSGTPATFNTFCVDLFHSISLNQNYAVTVRDDLATAFTNGARIAEVYLSHGEPDLSALPDQAAAVQIAVWDLSLSNHNPTTFSQVSGSDYSSGDPSVFNVDFGSDADAATIAGLVNSYLQESISATSQGSWLDASAAGDNFNRGQSLLIPPSISTNFPEPASISLLVVAGGALGLRRRRA
jgi:hypothetical protein